MAGLDERPVVVTSTTVATPIGELLAFLHDGVLCSLLFPDGREQPEVELRRRFGRYELRPAPAPDLQRAFKAYLGGELGALDTIAAEPGGTPFQRSVWDALRRIPVGRTVSYADIAREIGSPAAVRAVGAANGRNPVAIVIPCHRVVQTGGGLGGYGGGLPRKRWLLDHERAIARSLF
jgi:methylated-DNA-[protein]-cysteine S-methyltransferase